METSISFSSDVMKEYKQQEIISDQACIKAVSLKDKFVFFSIGSDQHLYLFYTCTNDTVEWKKCDISARIEKLLGIKEGKAITFDLSAKNDAINVLTALESGELIHATFDASICMSASKVPFKAVTPITGIYYSEECIIVDTLAGNDFVDRRTIDLNGEVICLGPVEAKRNSISRKGRCTNQDMDGIYSLVQNTDKSLIYYTPSYDKYGGKMPLSKKLDTPPCSKMIATLQISPDKPYTHLFAAAGNRIFFYPYNKQKEANPPICICESDLCKGAIQMYSYYFEGKAEVWLLNDKAEIVKLQCHGDDLEIPENWSQARVIKSDIDYFYPVEDKTAGNSFYAISNEGGKKSILHAIKSQQTSEWTFRQMALPSLNESNMYMRDVYRTKITLTRQPSIDGKDMQPQTIDVKPLNDGFAYINGKYHYLKAGKSIQVNAAQEEEITIVEPIEDLNSNSFSITIPSTGKSVDINPSHMKTQKLFELNTGENLKNAKIYDQTGKSTPLVTLQEDKDYNSVANAIKKFKEINSQLPAHGQSLSTQQLQNTLQAGTGTGPFLLRITGEGISHYEGEALQNLMLTDKTLMMATNMSGLSINLSDFGDTFSDAINWIKKQIKPICDIMIDGLKIVFTIAEKTFDFIVDCFSKLISSLEILFEAIGTFSKKLIDYLRFIFNTNDIKYTKEVFCKLMDMTFAEMKANVQNAKATVHGTFDNLVKNIEHWGDIENQKTFNTFKVNDFFEKASQINRFRSAPATYFEDIIKEQANNLFFPDISFTPPELKKFEELFSKSGLDMSKNKFLVDLVNNFISNGINGFLDVIKKIISSFVTTGLNLIKECVDVLFDLLLYILDNIMVKLFNYPIRIPIISYILKDILGITGELTLKDLVGYMIAFPVTVIYKIAFNKSPFNKQQVEDIAKVESMAGFVQLINNPTPQRLNLNQGPGMNDSDLESNKSGLPMFLFAIDVNSTFVTMLNRTTNFKIVPFTLICNIMNAIPATVWIVQEATNQTRAELFTYCCQLMKFAKITTPFISFFASLKKKEDVEKGAEAFNTIFSLIDIFYIALYLGHNNWRNETRTLCDAEILENSGAICDNISRSLDSFLCISGIEGTVKYVVYATSSVAAMANLIMESASIDIDSQQEWDYIPVTI